MLAGGQENLARRRGLQSCAHRRGKTSGVVPISKRCSHRTDRGWFLRIDGKQAHRCRPRFAAS
jgi:hypothetical protein